MQTFRHIFMKFGLLFIQALLSTISALRVRNSKKKTPVEKPQTTEAVSE